MTSDQRDQFTDAHDRRDIADGPFAPLTGRQVAWLVVFIVATALAILPACDRVWNGADLLVWLVAGAAVWALRRTT